MKNYQSFVVDEVRATKVAHRTWVGEFLGANGTWQIVPALLCPHISAKFMTAARAIEVARSWHQKYYGKTNTRKSVRRSNEAVSERIAAKQSNQ